MTTSNCTNTFQSPDYYNCECVAGYLRFNNSMNNCMDLCSMNNDTCNRTSTDCRGTPGKGRHYDCLCKNGFARVDSNQCKLLAASSTSSSASISMETSTMGNVVESIATIIPSIETSTVITATFMKSVITTDISQLQPSISPLSVSPYMSTTATTLYVSSSAVATSIGEY